MCQTRWRPGHVRMAASFDSAAGARDANCPTICGKPSRIMSWFMCDRRDWLFVLAEEGIRACCGSIRQSGSAEPHSARAGTGSGCGSGPSDAGPGTISGALLVAVAAQRLLPDRGAGAVISEKTPARRASGRCVEGDPYVETSICCQFRRPCVRPLWWPLVLAVWMFPLQSAGADPCAARSLVIADGPGVTVEPGAQMMHRPRCSVHPARRLAEPW